MDTHFLVLQCLEQVWKGRTSGNDQPLLYILESQAGLRLIEAQTCACLC